MYPTFGNVMPALQTVGRPIPDGKRVAAAAVADTLATWAALEKVPADDALLAAAAALWADAWLAARELAAWEVAATSEALAAEALLALFVAWVVAVEAAPLAAAAEPAAAFWLAAARPALWLALDEPFALVTDDAELWVALLADAVALLAAAASAACV